VSFLVGCLTVTAMAQPHGCDMKKGRGNHHPHDWGDMAANLENLRILKMLETIDLSEEQSAQFLPLFHEFRRDTREIHQKRDEVVERIRDMLSREVSDNEIKSELEKLRSNAREFAARLEKFFNDCEGVLTTRQMARLMIFHERFERDMLKSLREFRRHGRQDTPVEDSGKI
jgi:Spy/CpxP family protein refolding chaperone